MPNNLKQEIEKEFNKERNYNTILFEGERMNDMGKNIRKNILATAYLVIIAIVGFLGLNTMNSPKENLEISKNNQIPNTQEEKLKIDLNINKIDNMGSMRLDADIRIIEMNELQEKFNFIQNVKVPEEYKFKDSYNIFVKSNIDIKKYDKLHDYVFVYQKDELNDIQIAFSEVGEPLRDYYLGEMKKKSKIGDVEVIISKYKEMYNAIFKKNNIYFDIETNGITESELVNLLVSIIN